MMQYGKSNNIKRKKKSKWLHKCYATISNFMEFYKYG